MERIRDRGNSDYRARQIQGVVAFLGQLTGERVMPQKAPIETSQLGWDSLGDYHDPALRTEHLTEYREPTSGNMPFIERTSPQ